MRNQLFSLEEERYLVGQIGLGDDRTATKTLQWLCEKLRGGASFLDNSKIKSAVLGRLERGSTNTKRWCINTLALVGNRSDVAAIMAVPDISTDPDLLVSAVAALFALTDSMAASATLSSVGIPLQGIALIAAAQHSPWQREALARQGIPLETEDEVALRAAIILAGTKNRPEHIFHRTLSNIEAISELNAHHIPSVSKYSIWALDQLNAGFQRLKIPPQSIHSCPAEVRKWIFRLLASDRSCLSQNLDLFDTVRLDESSEVREEVAIELRDVYVVGIERIIRQWYLSEDVEAVKRSLLDHMAAQSDHCIVYSELVKEIYRTFPQRSEERQRLEVAASKTRIYRELRKIDYTQEHQGLFANDNLPLQGGSMTQMNFYNSNVSGVTGSGNVSAETISAVNNVGDPAQKELLERLIRIIEKSSPSLREPAEPLVAAVAKEPTKSNWRKLLALIQNGKNAIVGAGEASESIGSITDQITNIIGLLG